jgi:hypothetical protein
MSFDTRRRGRLAMAALTVLLALGASAFAQGVYYNEVAKDGRIYVFASGQRFDTFQKSGGAEIGVAITRPGYGPNGETVVFDSEDAINLYNFKHGLAGEYFPKPKETPKSPFPAGKFSGLMFGDYYYYDKWHQNQISASNATQVEGQNGFWLRRLYFTYDLQFNPRFTTRFRIEADSSGQFAGGNLNPYVKDASLKWTYSGKQTLALGIQPSLSFDWLEGFWGLRHIEKTPEDLYKLDSSRDFALTASGPIEGVKNLFYSIQVGNESGNGSETDKFKTVRVEARYEMNPGIAVEGFYAAHKRAGGQDRTSARGFVGWRNKVARIGGQYTWQQRKSGKPDTPDQKIAIWSGFGVWEFAPKQADVFFRFDSVKGTLGSADTGLPGADGIDYWLMSTKKPFKTFVFGAEYYLHSSIRISPNVEWVKYDSDPDPTNFPGRDQDRLFRLTFYWTF